VQSAKASKNSKNTKALLYHTEIYHTEKEWVEKREELKPYRQAAKEATSGRCG
jgi:hypothetical protein